MEDKVAGESIEVIIIEVIAKIEVGIGPGKGYFPETLTAVELGVQAIVGHCQDLKPVQMGIE